MIMKKTFSLQCHYKIHNPVTGPRGCLVRAFHSLTVSSAASIHSDSVQYSHAAVQMLTSPWYVVCSKGNPHETNEVRKQEAGRHKPSRQTAAVSLVFVLYELHLVKTG